MTKVSEQICEEDVTRMSQNNLIHVSAVCEPSVSEHIPAVTAVTAVTGVRSPLINISRITDGSRDSNARSEMLSGVTTSQSVQTVTLKAMTELSLRTS